MIEKRMYLGQVRSRKEEIIERIVVLSLSAFILN
jgi:hypothetical protein